MTSLRPALWTLRPHQWVKNLFVAAPLVFSKYLLEPSLLGRVAIAVAAFCALSGAVYTFNDIKDVEADRAHPTKRNRPIAAGQLELGTARVLAATLAVVALALCAWLSPVTLAWAVAYVIVNLLYTLRLKHVAFVDVGLIASGFIARVAAGGAAIAVAPSKWLLLCTGLLATYLAMGKRAHELLAASRDGREATRTRAALAGYRVGSLRAAMALLGVATAAAYVLYTIAPHTVSFFGTYKLPWSAPFCFVGLVRFAWLALVEPNRQSPTDAMLRDPLFLLNLLAWGVVILVIVY